MVYYTDLILLYAPDIKAAVKYTAAPAAADKGIDRKFENGSIGYTMNAVNAQSIPDMPIGTRKLIFMLTPTVLG